MSQAENKADDFVSQFLIDYRIQKWEDVQQLNRSRQEIINQIADNSTSRSTLLVHINSELTILEFAKQRLCMPQKSIDEDLKKNVIEILTNRVNEMYNTLFFLFRPTCKAFENYIQFCTKNGLLDECSIALKILLTYRHINISVYARAAEFEVSFKNNIKQARLYFEKAMSITKPDGNQKSLLFFIFKMEIKTCEIGAVDYNICVKCFQDAINVAKDDPSYHWTFFFHSLQYPNIQNLHSVMADKILKIYKSHDKSWYTAKHENYIMSRAIKELQNLIEKESLHLCEILIKLMQDVERHDAAFVMYSTVAHSSGTIWRSFRPKFLELCYHTVGLKKARMLFRKLKALPPPCLILYKTILRFEVNSSTIKVKTPTRRERIIQRGKQVNFIRNIYSEACNKFGKTNTELWMDFIRFENDYGDKQNVNKIYNDAKKLLTIKHMPLMESEFKQFKNNVKDDIVTSKIQEEIIQID